MQGRPHTFILPSSDSSRAVVSYSRKYVHEVLVNRLGGLSLPRKNVVRLTTHPDMTIDVYHGHKTTQQQQHTVELQWLEHLWDHENMFKTGVVRANEC